MQQYIGFKLNDNEFTLPILKVREIINTPAVTKLPQSARYVRGIINLRGAVIPVLDLKEMVSMGSTDGIASKTIVISDGQKLFGILVDEITSVVNIDEADVEPAESFLQENIERVEGVAKVDDRLIILLDTDKLVDVHGLDILKEGALPGIPEADEPAAVEGEAPRRLEPPREQADVLSPEPPAPAEPSSGKGEAGEKAPRVHPDVKEALQKYADDETRSQIVEKIIELIDALAGHDYRKADQMISVMLQASEGSLFKEIGRVTRKLHDSLRSFREALGPKIRQITDVDVPKAVDSLEFVLTRSEAAANRTMDMVEKYQKEMDSFSTHAGKVKSPKRTAQYFTGFEKALRKDLDETLVAQEFQDLTGQSVRGVIELVNAIEAELVALIASFGVGPEGAAKGEISQKVSQDEVDDLLKEFGF
jgi:chemotaxis protein CheZ